MSAIWVKTTYSRWPKRLFLFLCVVCLAVQAAPSMLYEQLEEMAETHGFEIAGSHRIGDEPARDSDGNLGQRLKRLLTDYNYVLQKNKNGGIARLIVTGKKRPRSLARRQGAIRTTRRGAHHEVDAILTGPNGVRKRAQLLLDTGATTVVLPTSMLETLGFDSGNTHEAQAQTANGKVAAKAGMLQSVQVGAVSATDVAVTFIEDERLEGNLLLGMSFLEQFRLTVDDKNNQIILNAR